MILAGSEKLELLANAELVQMRGRRKHVRARVLKSVLVVIAAHDGQVMSQRGLAIRAGVAIGGGIEEAILALVADGLIIRRHRGQKYAYSVSYERLIELQTKEPLFRVGKPRTRADASRRTERQRVRRDWKKRAAAERVAGAYIREDGR